MIYVDTWDVGCLEVGACYDIAPVPPCLAVTHDYLSPGASPHCRHSPNYYHPGPAIIQLVPQIGEQTQFWIFLNI